MSLSPDLAPHTNSQKDVLVYADPPTTFDDSFKFEGHAGELNMPTRPPFLMNLLTLRRVRSLSILMS